MSATNRGTARQEGDFYETPAWAVHRLLDVWRPPPGLWLEPSCGMGSIIRAVNEWPGWATEAEERPAWRCVDIDPFKIEAVWQEPGIKFAIAGDYVRWNLPPEIRVQRFDACVMNPPYSLADRFVKTALGQCDVVAALLRLNWLAGAQRARWLRGNEPGAVFVLPNRPDFTGGGGDATDYAWMVWGEIGWRGVHILEGTSRWGR